MPVSRKRRRRTPDTDELTPRELKIAWAVSTPLAAGGVAWYATDPRVESYQVSLLLVVPFLALALYSLSRVIPEPVQWAGGLVFAAIGVGGWLVVGGDQWWNWGQMAVLPLMMLIVRAQERSSGRQGESYGAMADGPWGPPGTG